MDLVQTSCAFAVPLFEYGEQRRLMDSWAATKCEDGLPDYQDQKNRFSIDGFRNTNITRTQRVPVQGTPRGILYAPTCVRRKRS
jgi:hypothetical protein